MSEDRHPIIIETWCKINGCRADVYRQETRRLKDERAALEARLSKMEDALEHCGYDPTDCIDCGGPPHNEWCRFWKLRDVVPILFTLAEETQ